MQRESYEKSKKEYEQRFVAKTPVEFLKYNGHIVTETDLKMIMELQELGLSNGVINVLLEYALLVSRSRILHPLVVELGENWLRQDISSVEQATEYLKEEMKKYIHWLDKNR